MLNSANMNIDPTQAYGIHDGSGIFDENKKKNNFGMYLNKTAKGTKKSQTQSKEINGVMSSRTHNQRMSESS